MIGDNECGAMVGLSRETEVFGENLSQFHFVHYKSHITCLGVEPESLLWEEGD
jgi:hypothetical protein